MLRDMLEVTQKVPGHLPFLKPILQGRSLGFENQGLQMRGPRAALCRSRRMGLGTGRQQGLGGLLQGPALLRSSALGADPLVTPCSNPPSPSPPLGLSVHIFKMVIIVSAPKGEEELRTGPKWLKVEHFVGRMGGTLAHGTWFRLPVSLQQLGSNH